MSLKIFAAGCVYIFLDLLEMFVCDFIKYMFNNLYNTHNLYVTSNLFILSLRCENIQKSLSQFVSYLVRKLAISLIGNRKQNDIDTWNNQ